MQPLQTHTKGKGVITIPNPFSKEMTLKEWMAQYGYRWVEGREELCKGLMGVVKAMDIMYELKAKGAIV